MRNVLEDMKMCCGTTCNKADNIEYVQQLEYLLAMATMLVLGIDVDIDEVKLGTSLGDSSDLVMALAHAHFPEHFK